MKHLLILISLLALMTGCVSQAQEDTNQLRLAEPYLVIDEYFIYDETIQGDKMCAEMIEVVLEKNGLTYALPCLKSDLISFVRSDTYESFSLKDILEQELIPLDVLVENNILILFDPNE
ncbi:MAG: hypothetical protein KGZ38_03555 [Erysipelothrix sp.]|jgi:hypothetical protein|nr:hypothetical protein [Erysipelothrix sp.]